MYTKLHAKSYNSNRLFLTVNPDTDIPQNDPVRMINAIVERFELKDFLKKCSEWSRCDVCATRPRTTGRTWMSSTTG